MATVIEIKNDNVEKFKEHIKKYKVAYITGGVSLAVITCLIVRGSRASGPITLERPERESTDSFNLFSSGNNSPNIVNVLEREGRGHPGYMTHCLDLDTYYPSQTVAAVSFGGSQRPGLPRLHR